MIVYSALQTQTAFEKEIKSIKSLPDIRYRPFQGDPGIAELSKSISDDDMIIIVSARKGTISYNSHIENSTGRMIRQFADNNFILLYPEQAQVDYLENGMQTQDLKLSPIQEQIDNLNKLGKAVKKIFKGSGAKSAEPDDK